MAQLAEDQIGSINATTPSLPGKDADQLLKDLDGWKIITRGKEPRLEKTFKFNDFQQALDFTTRIGALANEADHHPAILTEWGKVTVDWWTHKIKGLHRNDFIMAARTDQVGQDGK